MRYIVKITLSEIRSTLGRYLAIAIIIALGVGVFAGLISTKNLMLETANDYINENSMYDFKLLSTGGLLEEELGLINDMEGVKEVEGAYSFDVLGVFDEEEIVIKLHSITENINKLTLSSGRMPSNNSECVADKAFFTKDDIGKKIVITQYNADLTQITEKELEIVGIGVSPIYMNFERGTTDIGDGKVDCFIFVPGEVFSNSFYNEAYVKLEDSYYIYSDEYNNLIDTYEAKIKDEMDSIISKRNSIFKNYVLGRDTNTGYVCFESDSNIMADIAKVFPVFFLFISALVCMTTMTHMVNDQRIQIGILKALGYSRMSISFKYNVYSGSSALIGSIVGYFTGAYLIPKIIWFTFSDVYGFADIKLVWDYRFAFICIIVSLICSIGSTWLSCNKEFISQPAELIRPKAPKGGKKILLEKITFIWNRLGFLYKISIRNLFRYKQRLIMMIIGISGASALLITGLGLRDSTQGIVSKQYDNITFYDYQITFDNSLSSDALNHFFSDCEDILEDILPVSQLTLDIVVDDVKKSINLVAIDDKLDISKFIGLHNHEEIVSYPKYNEAVISVNIAKRYNIQPNDIITIQKSDYDQVQLKVTGIFDNYINNYIYITEETYRENFGSDNVNKVIYANLKDKNDIYTAAQKLMSQKGVTSINIMEDARIRFDKVMSSLQYIVFLVILCSGILAFVVIYNLTNINIIERQREISTTKVLGFYNKETTAYVFRENIIITVIGYLISLFFGTWLHSFVMSNIRFDKIYFDCCIFSLSYLIAFILIMIFTLIIHVFLKKYIIKIDMLKALKAVE